MKYPALASLDKLVGEINTHPDFDPHLHESKRDAQHKYGMGKDVIWYDVPDTREGWAKAVEMFETLAFEKVHRDKVLILDFSLVRPKGAPINRPCCAVRCF